MYETPSEYWIEIEMHHYKYLKKKCIQKAEKRHQLPRMKLHPWRGCGGSQWLGVVGVARLVGNEGSFIPNIPSSKG